MAYKLKQEKKKMFITSDNYKTLYEDLDFIAYQKYGTKYGNLDKKTKKKLAKELIKEGY
jgi:hypothetical protein